MNEMSQLALVLVFAAGMLILGQLHIRNGSSTDSFVVQAIQASQTQKPNNDTDLWLRHRRLPLSPS
jgi:hypothetical protein